MKMQIEISKTLRTLKSRSKAQWIQKLLKFIKQWVRYSKLIKVESFQKYSKLFLNSLTGKTFFSSQNLRNGVIDRCMKQQNFSLQTLMRSNFKDSSIQFFYQLLETTSLLTRNLIVIFTMQSRNQCTNHQHFSKDSYFL